MASSATTTSNGEAMGANGDATTTEETQTVLLKDIEFDFLELIYETIRSIEKESSNESMAKMLPGGQPSAFTDCHNKMQQLGDKFAKFREQIGQVAGVDTCRTDQLEQLRLLRQQLMMRKELLMKYKQLNFADNLARMIVARANAKAEASNNISTDLTKSSSA